MILLTAAAARPRTRGEGSSQSRSNSGTLVKSSRSPQGLCRRGPNLSIARLRQHLAKLRRGALSGQLRCGARSRDLVLGKKGLLGQFVGSGGVARGGQYTQAMVPAPMRIKMNRSPSFWLPASWSKPVPSFPEFPRSGPN